MSMRLDIITLFPAMFSGPFDESIIGRARKAGQVDINLINLRDFTHDKHRTVDDRPYGGGAGMVLKPEPIFEAVESLRTPECRVIILSPQGRPFKQAVAAELALVPHLILICGAYEGFDERVRIGLVDDEISIGDFVMTNGSLPAMVLTDTVVRLLPGVLGCSASSEDESFSHGRLEYPQYTRPDEFRGMRVPDILTSGNHQAVDEWRRQQALDRTRSRRPDLIDNEPTQG